MADAEGGTLRMDGANADAGVSSAENLEAASAPPRTEATAAEDAAHAGEAAGYSAELTSATSVAPDVTAPIQQLRTARYSKLSELRPHTVGLNFVLRVQQCLPREKLALIGDESGSMYMLVRSG